MGNVCNPVEDYCLRAMKIVHHHAYGRFDWLISGHQSVNPSREVIFILSGKYKRFIHPVGTLSFKIFSPPLYSIHPIQLRLTHCFDAYIIGLVSYQKVESEDQFQGQIWGVFLTVLLVRTNFFFINRNYFIMASSIQKITPINVGKYVKS